MERMVDARGLACPEPVLLTLKEMKKGKGQITILVDAEVSKENVLRAAKREGWHVVSIETVGNDYRILIKCE
jgi:TusA-related sulfurtransferase